jgi:hypothetical protein
LLRAKPMKAGARTAAKGRQWACESLVASTSHAVPSSHKATPSSMTRICAV